MEYAYSDFLKKPKVNIPFHKWYEQNIKFGEHENILLFMREKNVELDNFYTNYFNLNESFDINNFDKPQTISDGVFKDSFLKKLQIIENIKALNHVKNSDYMKFDFFKINDAMETYEDVIREIAQNRKVVVPYFGSFIYNNRNYQCVSRRYDSFKEFKMFLDEDCYELSIFYFIITKELKIITKEARIDTLYRNEFLKEKISRYGEV